MVRGMAYGGAPLFSETWRDSSRRPLSREGFYTGLGQTHLRGERHAEKAKRTPQVLDWLALRLDWFVGLLLGWRGLVLERFKPQLV